MSVNANKPKQWKRDIAQSVDYYNDWFMRFAPKVYRETREQTAQQVLSAFEITNNLLHLSSDTLKSNPSILQILRMATAPPIARDRLIGLAGVSGNLVKNMEQKNRLPPRMKETKLDEQLAAIGEVIARGLVPGVLIGGAFGLECHIFLVFFIHVGSSLGGGFFLCCDFTGLRWYRGVAQRCNTGVVARI